ncbi:MAG: universal stress protein [Bryobacteraceae bacterium]
MDIRRILFPVDFSQRTARTAPLVSAMARQVGAEVALLHVVGTIPHWLANAELADGEPEAMRPPDTWIALRRSQLENWAKDEWTGVAVRRYVEIGDPAHLISEFVSRNQVDLIMMPTHGFGRFRRWLLGSVTGKVLHDTECPVWTDVHMPEPVPREGEVRRILCALDLEDESGALLQWSRALAEKLRAELRLVHAIPAAEHIPGQPDDPFRAHLLRIGREQMEELQRRYRTELTATVVSGNVASAVALVAGEWAADLVVIGRTPAKKGPGRLHSHAYAIIRESPCPVISV